MVRIILLEFQRLCISGITRYSDDSFIIGSEPDVSLLVLRDMANVA